MKKEDLYKKIVLGLLFVFPLLVYLFFASGKNNFAKLPILSKGITEIQNLEFQADNPVSLKDQISIIGYWGGSLKNKQAEALNLNEKIYKRFYEFADFQFVFFVNNNRLSQVDSLKRALKEGVGTDLTKWNFIAATTDEIQTHFTSLQTPIKLDQDGSTPYVFIIDKDFKFKRQE